MTIIVISNLKEGLNVSRFISIFVVEVTTIHNSTWVGIHAYVLEKWKWIFILFTLEKIQ